MGAGWGLPKRSPANTARKAEELAQAVEDWKDSRTTGSEERVVRALDNYRRVRPREDA